VTPACPRVQVNAEVLLYAVRYALGRKSAAVKEVTHEVVRLNGQLPTGLKATIAEDVVKAAEEGRLGDRRDALAWLGVVEIASAEDSPLRVRFRKALPA
jgi:hypothetical protein